MSSVALALLVGTGLALVVVGVLLRVRGRDQDLSSILDLPFGERDVNVRAISERPVLVRHGTALANRAVDRFDRDRALAAALATAGIPLVVGEYVLLAAGGGLVAAVVMFALTQSWLLGVAGLLAAIYGAVIVPRVVARRRRSQIEAQLPDALSMIAASLEAGHTFLRAISLYAEESQPPLAEELAEVVRATTLGEPVLEALERMADRLRIEDLDWTVQALRIQQTTGGRLADVLRTLAEFMRAREEVRREVKVLTAEGRTSAWVLGAMPPVLFVTFQTLNPGYADPLLRGWGLVVLGAAALSTAVGVGVIARMVRIEV